MPDKSTPSHGFAGERVLMRILIGERDRYHGRPVYEAIVDLLRNKHFAGATVVRGAMGFGAGARLHSDRSDYLWGDLPMVIECVETEERIESVLPEIDAMIGGGLITFEKVRVILYRPPAASDGLG